MEAQKFFENCYLIQGCLNMSLVKFQSIIMQRLGSDTVMGHRVENNAVTPYS